MSKSSNLPIHVARAEDHVARMFSQLTSDHYRMMRILDAQKYMDIDLEIARITFDEIAYRVIFQNCSAEAGDLSDPQINQSIWEDVILEWPETYYLELYVKAGIAYKFDGENGETIYGVKDRHIEELTKLLTAKSTK